MATLQQSTRAGHYVSQLSGAARYNAFVPNPLPPDPPVLMDSEMWKLLSDADRALGRLDGVTEVLPNPDFFVAMYVHNEAVLSSQIEGTQASLVDILEYEADKATRGLPDDVAEVVNYVDAMNYGFERLQSLPVSLRLICEIHARLLSGVRGQERSPGEFRTSQNWIGAPGTHIANASFVPPAPDDMKMAMFDLEAFLHDGAPRPVLLEVAMVHAQFETIHPFLDGNGRVGRLLITFLLCQRGILKKPLLYLSYYFKRNRQEYYDRLMRVRTHGDWEGWLRFFLRGVCEVAHEATGTARRIIALREEHRLTVSKIFHASLTGQNLLDLLYESPMVSVRSVVDRLKISKPSANDAIRRFVDEGLLRQRDQRLRNRLFEYAPYIDLFLEPPDDLAPGEAQSTEPASP